MTMVYPAAHAMWLSWRSIIAGVFTALAVATVLNLIGIALGLSPIEPAAEDPLSGVATTFSAWSFIYVLLSLGIGGFTTGYTAGSRGCEHGFLMWATVLLLGTMVTGHAINLATKAAASTTKGVGSGGGIVASGAAQGMSGVIANAIQGIHEAVNLEFASEDFSPDVSETLRDTGVETLRPRFLQGQMREARSDLRTTMNQLLMNPQNADPIIEQFLDTQRIRMSNIGRKIDRDAMVKTLMAKRQIPQQEAAAMLSEAMRVFTPTAHKTLEMLAEARHQLTEAKVHLRSLADQARVQSEKWTTAAAASAMLAAVALIIGAVVSIMAGHFGSRWQQRYKVA